jgi:hypothetical protein
MSIVKYGDYATNGGSLMYTFRNHLPVSSNYWFYGIDMEELPDYRLMFAFSDL